LDEHSKSTTIERYFLGQAADAEEMPGVFKLAEPMGALVVWQKETQTGQDDKSGPPQTVASYGDQDVELGLEAKGPLFEEGELPDNAKLCMLQRTPEMAPYVPRLLTQYGQDIPPAIVTHSSEY